MGTFLVYMLLPSASAPFCRFYFFIFCIFALLRRFRPHSLLMGPLFFYLCFIGTCDFETIFGPRWASGLGLVEWSEVLETNPEHPTRTASPGCGATVSGCVPPWHKSSFSDGCFVFHFLGFHFFTPTFHSNLRPTTQLFPTFHPTLSIGM